MSEFRRFLSYIYSYRDSVKQKNTGFAKVEARGELLRVQVHIKGMYPLGTTGCQVYGFYRQNEWMRGVLLGEFFLKNGNGDMAVVTDRSNISDTGISLEQLGGIYIVMKDNPHVVMASAWDNDPVETQYFTVHQESEEVSEHENTEKHSEYEERERVPGYEKSERVPGYEESERVPEYEESERVPEYEPTGGALEHENREKIPKYEPTGRVLEHENREKVPKYEPTGRVLEHENTEKVSGYEPTGKVLEHENTEKVSEYEQSKKDLEYEKSEKGSECRNTGKISRHENTEKVSAYESDSIQEVQKFSAEPKLTNTGVKEPELMEEQKKTIDGSQELTRENQETEENLMKEQSILCGEMNISVDNYAKSASHCGQKISWHKIMRKYPVVHPFEHKQNLELVRIEPKDLSLLAKSYWALGNNSFLLHGYCSYRYLILGRNPENNSFFLGIPGIFHPREKLIANMFGFPEFYMSRNARLRQGEFGYYVRKVELLEEDCSPRM